MSVAAGLPEFFRLRLARLAGGYANPRPKGRRRVCFVCRRERSAEDLVRNVCTACRSVCPGLDVGRDRPLRPL